LKLGILPKVETQTIEFLKENETIDGRNVIGTKNKKN
jgi:hypothetical protein